MQRRVRLPSISLIVARSYPGNVIGYNNKLPWHLKTDLQRFRQITSGHAIIMGRNTFDSIGRALPHRTNVVMSRSLVLRNNNDFYIDDETNLHFTNTLEDALFYADIASILRGKRELFIIGGSTLYTLFDDLVNKVYLTEVFGDFPGDAFFNLEFPKPKWRIIDETDYPKNHRGDDYSYRLSILEKRDRRNRSEFVAQFFTDKNYKDQWLKQKLNKRPKIFEEYVQENLELED